ncbi:type IV toxin-antitoxin system AbiEi family antitoxin domain-containing protein [Pseudonocardia halophobica]|uniref:type IV toxin-antitoxin system AbiEi family antitoxin domain-containing protein n=1 Tax=Pseudonocardia halophobica TaxID=29401 RepID=UPI003D8AD1F2
MDSHGLRTRRSLLDAGLTAAEIRRMRNSGALALVRRGAYTDPADERLQTPEARHALLVRATLPLLAKGSVISHTSAAVLHGLRLWAVRLDRVHVTRDATSGGRTSRRFHLHTARLREDEIVEIDGIAVTTPARTAVDLARTLPYEQAVVAVDSALDLQRDRTPGRRRSPGPSGSRRSPEPPAGPVGRLLVASDGSPPRVPRAWGSPAAGSRSRRPACLRRCCNSSCPGSRGVSTGGWTSPGGSSAWSGSSTAA